MAEPDLASKIKEYRKLYAQDPDSFREKFEPQIYGEQGHRGNVKLPDSRAAILIQFLNEGALLYFALSEDYQGTADALVYCSRAEMKMNDQAIV